MQGFFDFLETHDRYADDRAAIDRLNWRHAMILAPLAADVAGARVLDLGAHDGRWAHAFAALDAREVVAIEGRAALVAQYAAFPDPAVKARVSLRQGELFEAAETLAKAGESFDIIALLGIFYHVMDHHRLLRLCAALRPRMVIIDSEFALRPGPVITLVREETENPLNAIPQVDGQRTALVGIPSIPAIEAMADTLGFDATWVDWGGLAEPERAGLGDYYRPKGKRRGTVILRPR
jgi:hypothetical protein